MWKCNKTISIMIYLVKCSVNIWTDKSLKKDMNLASPWKPQLIEIYVHVLFKIKFKNWRLTILKCSLESYSFP